MLISVKKQKSVIKKLVTSDIYQESFKNLHTLSNDNI